MAVLDANQALVLYARPDAVLAAGADALVGCLSATERERHGRLRFAPDRDAYLVAHALTRRVLGELCGVAPAQLEISRPELGRPEIIAPEAARGLELSLSHARGLVACAVARGLRVGVDVESLERRLDLLAVGRNVFSPDELRGLAALEGDARQRRFFELWTLKEAYAKAIGKGLTAPLRSITFDPDRADPVPVVFGPEVGDDASAWCFRRHAPGTLHCLALALNVGKPAAISFREVDLRGSLLE